MNIYTYNSANALRSPQRCQSFNTSIQKWWAKMRLVLSFLETVLKPFMDYFTCLFLFEKLNFKRNKSHYYFQNKISQIKICKQTNLKKGFKIAS